MKGITTISVLVAFVAATYGAPVADGVVDWALVNGKIEEIRAIMKDVVIQVGDISNADNPTIGPVINEKLHASEKQAHAILGRVKSAVTAQTLTAVQARSFFRQLESILGDLMNTLRTDVGQLSPEAQGQIVEILAISRYDATQTANEVYDLLAAATVLADWKAVNAKIEEIRADITNAATVVRATAIADNPMVGEFIAERLGGAGGQANAVLGKAKQAIRRQTLNVEQARGLFQELQAVLSRLKNIVIEEVDQLSATAQAMINDILIAGLSQVEQKASEIYDLLGATIHVVDWSAVDTKVEEVRTGIINAVAVVRSTAISDNPIVGGVIAERLGIAVGQASAVLGNAKQAIRDQSLTEDQARGHFQELEAILSGLQTNLEEEVNQLSPTAQAMINETLVAGVSQVEKQAGVIYGLLSQLFS